MAAQTISLKKGLESIKEIVKAIKAHVKAGDWSSANDVCDQLTEAVLKKFRAGESDANYADEVLKIRRAIDKAYASATK